MYNKLHEIDYRDNQSVEIKVSMETPKVSMATAPTPHAGVLFWNMRLNTPNLTV